MKDDDMPDYGPRDIEDDYFQDIYRADRILARANSGDLDAMYQMGRCFYFGEGRQENNRLALKFFLKPAEAGNADAMFYVGCIYETGEKESKSEFRGIPQDPAEAARWFARAADLGHKRAAEALERLTGAGIKNNG